MSQDVYGEPTIIQRPNGVDIVSHPILPDEERARRMKRIARSAAALYMAQYERKMRDEKNKGRLHSPVVDADRHCGYQSGRGVRIGQYWPYKVPQGRGRGGRVRLRIHISYERR